MFGDAIYGDLIFGGGSLFSGDQDPDGPIVNVIIHDATNRVSYRYASGVRVLNDPDPYVEVLSPDRSWVKILK